MSDHIAILRKSWKLKQKIATGQKTIESRWYQHKYSPWNKIRAGEDLYFKESGCPITLKAKILSIKQFSELTPAKTKSILIQYGKYIGLSKNDIPMYCEKFKDKRYCILIFLKDVELVEPFDINKKGFACMAAWLTVPSIKSLLTTI